MKRTGSQIVMEVLLEHNVDTVFGYPGGAALNVYDALYDYSDKIHHYITAHEQGAAHAADGYARSTGKTGVVFSTSGPGATNLVTGIATAYMDSIPMVAITCNVSDNMIGRDSFQEISITGVTLPITKHNYFVNKIENLADALRNAFRIANEGRKGPVLVDITKDVTAATTDYTPHKPLPLEPHPKFSEKEINQVAKIINTCKRPVLYFGGGVEASDARDELYELIQKADMPATYTMMAAGVIDCDDPKNLGLIGMHGTIAANKAIDQADLVIAIGTRFSDRVALNPKRFAPKAAIIQIDIDASEINKNVLINYSIIGDTKDVLQALLPKIEERKHTEWVEQVTSYQKTVRVPMKGAKLRPKELIEATCDLTDKDTIYVTDVGQHQMWAAQYVRHHKTHRFLTSGGLGTMGFGYGAAIGAQVGNPDKRVIHFTGDGSFHMNLNEGCTAVSYDLPIITIIMDNKVLGMVYQWQTVFYNKHYSQTVLNRKTDFVKVAEGFGATGFACNTLDEFKDAFQKALKINGPVWIACNIDKEERVLPMIPNGGTIDDMIKD
ncbi:biosynthetic-type acetolactate synthase large subunit [Absicoccus intestinalis]|uniref:Acetolactate synthase n=1 Tax=Absicoccus intestinalis TaxID=2926319 RepID=A0ABU4WJD1_9FIRM|nr:biosynthetic-type acetolactate synthase large subunit [Absicoccus sp. CLA-KB-P134]MDX8416658.1 biosynthetic-type acetolactate synthase large subunit [Absicoccus sp. CLA-KB-P134]